MNKLERAKDWIDHNRDLFLELVRVYLGAALTAKGIAFAVTRESIGEQIPQLGWATGIAAHYVVPVHMAFGLMLAIGLVTRAAAIANIPILLGAALFVHGAGGLFTRTPSLELDLLVLFLLLVFAFAGSGRMSVDYYLEQHSSHRPSRPLAA